jgi:YD repeat-containing protein
MAMGAARGQIRSLFVRRGNATYAYNHPGLLATVTRPAGVQQQVVYNILDQPTTRTDANGVPTTQTFDRLGRLLTRAYPGQGTEQFVYSVRGLTSYTGPDAKTTTYVYDEAARKTSELTPQIRNPRLHLQRDHLPTSPPNGSRRSSHRPGPLPTPTGVRARSGPTWPCPTPAGSPTPSTPSGG